MARAAAATAYGFSKYLICKIYIYFSISYPHLSPQIGFAPRTFVCRRQQKAATAQGGTVTASPSTKPQMSPCGPVPRPIPKAKKAAARGWGQRRPFDSTRDLQKRSQRIVT